MATMSVHLFVLAACIVCAASQSNLINQAGATGSEATLLSIGSVHQSGAFGDDNDLLRRIAFTETRDGTRADTYRDGYHGGIWAVDENVFMMTKDTIQNRRLPAKHQQIQLHYGIDWSTVPWTELRKPLYSALAARLVLYIAPEVIPPTDDLPAQGQFWASHYNTAGDPAVFVSTSGGLEGSILESSGNEFFLGFSTNYQATYAGDLQFFVNTPEPATVSFTVTATGFSFTGTATNHSTTIVTMPRSLEVDTTSERNKGIHVRAEGDRKIVIYGISQKVATTDAFLALPCSNLAVDTYEYYGITYPAVIPNLNGNILLVGCEDQTQVTTPSTTFTLNRLETYLIDAPDTTGLRVTTNKPISFFSNQRCNNVPRGSSACDTLIEQVPPTLTWGRAFFAASLGGRSSGELFRVLTAHDSTTLRVKCSASSDLVYTLARAGDVQEFQIAINNYCSIEASAPVVVMQFSLGNSFDGIGDPFMMMIPPVEQYSNNYILNVLSTFPTNFITIYVAIEFYQPTSILVDNVAQTSAAWTAIRCVDNSLCGYAVVLNMPPGEHSLRHTDANARVGVSAYGFDSYFNSYGYPGGLKLTPIQLATVSFAAASYRVSEEQTSLQIIVTRGSNLVNSSVVLVASDDFQGTASAREDYTSISQIIEFLPGETQKNFSVQIINDRRLEDNETFQLYLIAGAGVNLTPLSRTEITIENDDGMITLDPPFGSILGGTGVVVAGDDLIVAPGDVIACIFDGITTRGVYVNSGQVLCVSPSLQRTGKVPFMLTVAGVNSGESEFTSLTYSKCYGVYLDNDDLLFTNDTVVGVRWSPTSIFRLEVPLAYSVDISMLELNLTTGGWSELTLATNRPNTGLASVTIPRMEPNVTLDGIISPIVIRVSMTGGTTTLLTSLAQLGLRTSQTAPVRYVRKSDEITMQAVCTIWDNQQPTNIGQTILNILPFCPLTQRDARGLNSGYYLETFASTCPTSGNIPARVGNLVCGPIVSNTTNIVVDDKHKAYFHPSVVDCYRLRRTDLGGHSQQCCYNSNGFLVTGGPGGGNVDRYAPDTQLLQHFRDDVIPYLLCCKAGPFSKCNSFYDKRPSKGVLFIPPPPPARTRGDPHMITFDGHRYTFNGRGEFILVETPDNSFSVQGRMLPIITPRDIESQATVFKVIVARQSDSDTVQFEIVDNCGFLALVNGEQVIFGLINTQEFNNVTVSFLGNSTFSAAFSSGAYIEVMEENNIISVVSVSLPPTFTTTTRGLLGSFNGNANDDLLPNSGTQPIALTSTLQEVHDNFGITWIVDSPLDSLFTYRPGESWVTYYNPFFVPVFQPVFTDPDLMQQANTLCGDDLECLFDVAATDTLEIGRSTMDTGREIQEELEFQVPTVCQNPCAFGVCVANNTCFCEEGYSGATCSTPVFTPCDQNPCQFGGTCVQHGVNYICTCPLATSGDFCEINIDIDECDLELDECHPAATCTNTRGSYVCACPSGSSGDGFTCMDLCNECTGVPSNCGTHNCNTTTSDCTNTVGSFQCTCRFGLASDGLSCAPPPRPNPPTSVTISSVGTTTLTVTWVEPPPNNNISTYDIALTESGGSTITMIVLVGTSTYTFVGLEEYRTYSCVIIATSIYGPLSVPTTAVSSTTLETAPTAPPENFVATPTSPRSVTITWNPPRDDDINGVIIRYVINVTIVGSGQSFLLTSTTTTLTVTTLPYTTYVCIIAAVTSAGTGPFSTQVIVATPQAPPTRPPQSVTLAPVSSTSISLSWAPPPLNETHGVITEYRITITEVVTGNVITLTSVTTSITAVGLHPFYVYECIVSAFTVGNGPYSEVIRITTPEDVPSASPLNFGGTASTSRSATITWSPPPADQINGIIILYIINVTVTETGQTFQLTSTTTSLTVTTLIPYRNYVCIIAAVTAVGTGPFSGRFTLTTPQDVPTMAPQAPSATIQDSRTFVCSWTPPPSDHQHGVIVEYRISVTEVITGRVISLVSTGTSLVVGSLHPDYVYQWIVTAVTVGEGPYTMPMTIRTPEDVPTGSPTSSGGMALSSESLEITWQPPSLEDQNGVITGYVINFTNLDTGVTMQYTTTTATTLMVSSLLPYTIYTTIIAASTAVGLGPFTSAVIVQTQEAAPGSHPSNFTGSSLNSTHIYLRWDTPPPSQINGVIRSYHLNITEDVTGDVSLYTTDASTREITIGPLHPYYVYHCSVVAFTVEPGPYTSVFVIQTHEDNPSGPPTNFVATTSDSRTISLTWNPPNPEDQNGILRFYVVELRSILPTETRNISSMNQSITITGLRPYTAYDCTVSAGTVGAGPPTAITRLLTPEDVPSGPPQNFAITINDSRSLVLNWATPLPQDVNGIVTDYTINVSSSIGNSSFQIGTNVTTFTLTSLRPYITYTCSVATHTSIGQGPFSSSVTETTPEDAPEAPPVMIAQSSLMSRSVVLSWAPPRSDLQNGVIRHYVIEAYENDTGNLLTYQTPSDQTIFTLTGLHPYYTYTMWIAAVTVSTGVVSDPFTVLTLEDVPTAAPLMASGFPLTSTLITITWSPPPAEDINGILDNYFVEVTELLTNTTFMFHASTKTTINVGPLHPYYRYRCRVRAVTIGPGPYTAFFYVNSGEAPPTGAPTNLTAIQSTTQSLTLSWDLPRFDQQNGIIRYYIVTIDDIANGTSWEVNVNATRITIPGLQPFTTYNSTVAAFTVGRGPDSAPIMTTLPQGAPTVPPINVRGFAPDHSSISLEWDPPMSLRLNGILTGYIINVTERETGATFERNTTETSIVLSDLHPHYVYECRVAAYTVAPGPFSTVFAVQVLMAAPSGSPVNISAITLSSSSVEVTWDQPLPQHRNGPITAYNLTVTEQMTGVYVSSIMVSNTSGVVTSLRAFITYNFAVSARNSIGYGPLSLPVSQITGETIPQEPTAVGAIPVSGDPFSLLVMWSPPTTPNGLITHYNIYCQLSQTMLGSGGGETLSLDPNGPVFTSTVTGINMNATVSGFMIYTNYGCSVSANTSIGEGITSPVVYQNTDESTPVDSPTILQASVVNASSVSLTWLPPMTPRGIIVSYTILAERVMAGGMRNVTTVVVNASSGAIVTGLLPFSSYNFSVAASTKRGMGPYDNISASTPQGSPYGPPVSVVTMDVQRTMTNGSWMPPDENLQNGVILYYIVTLSDLVFGMPDVVINTTRTTISFTGLEEYGMYSYVVAAATSGGVGPPSAPVVFTTLENVPTAPPQNVSGTASSSTVIVLTWSPPPPLEVNGAIRHYTVEVVERHTGVTWNFVVVGQSLNVGGLHPFYLYDFKVSTTTVGMGPNSTTYSLQTLPEPPTAAPQQLTVGLMNSTSITLTWNPPPFEDTNGVIQYYTIQVTEVDTSSVLAPVTTPTNQVTLTGLHPHYVYQCIVAAFTVGTGPYTAPVIIQLNQDAPSSAPLGVTGFALNSESISLSWTPPPVSDRNGVIQHYQVDVAEQETGNTYTHISTRTNLTLFSLHPHYTYSITVSAVTVSPGPPSSPVVVMTDQDVPSGPVQEINVLILSSDEVTITWEAPNATDQNGVIISYLINITLVGTGQSFTRTSSNTSISLDSLVPFSSYSCRVVAITSVGMGPFSMAITFLTGEGAPTLPPESVTVGVVTSTSIALSWTPPSEESSNGIITEYRVRVVELDTGTQRDYVALSTSFVIQPLHPDYTYQVSVGAHTVLTGPFSTVQVFRTPEDAPSGYPQSFQIVSFPSPSSVVLSWEELLVDEQNGVITSYTINITETGSGNTIQRTVSSSQDASITVESLLPFTTYSCSIAASTAVGMGPFSILVTLNTPEDAPDMSPSNLVSMVQGSSTLLLSWDQPSGSHNGIIRQYTLNITEVDTGREFQMMSATTSLVITNLHPDYTYVWIVTAFTVEEGPYSSSDSVTTYEDVPSGPPASLNGSSLSSNSIRLTWSPPRPEDQNGDITGYVINVTNLDNETVHHYTTGVVSEFILMNLEPFTLYETLVFAFTAVGSGQVPAVVLVGTDEDAPGSQPLNSTGYAINSTHIALNWSAIDEEDLNGILREYRINVTEGLTGVLQQLTTSPDTTEIIVGPLHPFYIYHSTITAHTVEGGPSTNIISIRTMEDAPSGPPTGVSASATSTSSISVTWGPPTQNQQNGIIRYYLVTLSSGSGILETRNVTSTSTQQTVNFAGLLPYTAYNCIIQAETVELGPPNEAIQVYTAQDVPTGPPQDVVANSTDPSTLSISWAAPPEEQQNGLIQIYNISIIEIETMTFFQFITMEESIEIPDLHPYYSYSYSVSAVTEVGEGPYSVVALIRMPEGAPSSPPIGVQVTAVSATGFLVSWTMPPAVDHNGIIRSYTVSITEENTETLTLLTSQGDSLRVDSIHPYYNYTCAVAAVTVEAGPYSPPITITTGEAVPSGPPVNVVATAISSTSIVLTWDLPRVHERNGVITGFTITQASGGTFNTDDTTLTITDLEPFTSYTFSVSASTQVGSGPASGDVTEITLEDAPDGAPNTVLSSDVTSTSLTLSWLPPAVPNGMIRHYLIIVLEVNTGTNSTYQASHTSFSVGDLHPAYDYLINVFAVTVEAGPSSLDHTVTTLEDIPSAAPVGIAESAVDSRTLLVTWDPLPEESRNGAITEYVVQISAQETEDQRQLSTSGDATSLTIRELHPDYTYTYTVAAGTGVGTGPSSVFRSIKMPEDIPTGAPLNVTGNAINSTSIIFRWHLPEPALRNGDITGYSLIIREVETNTTTTYSPNGIRIELVVADLHPHYQYECRIAAMTGVGRGPYGDAVTTMTLPDAPSAVPSNVSAVAVTSRIVQVSWDPLPADQHNGLLLHYLVIVTVAQTRTTFTLNATSNSITIPDLHPAYDYSIVIAAVTISTGPFSAPLAVRTPDDAPSASPSGVSAASTTSTSIRISWQAPDLEFQNGQITSYHISVVELETGDIQTFTTVTTDSIFVVNGLHPFYYYNCSVAAYTNGLGPSDHFVVQTLEAAPTLPPLNVTVDVVDATSVIVSWEDPPEENQNGLIESYTVRVLGVDSEEDFTVSADSMEITVGDLHPFYSYKFTVAAVTVAQGPFSTTPVTVALPPLAPVSTSTVTNITTEILSPTSVRIQWLPSNQDTWNGIITRYTIQYSLLRQVATSQQTSFSELNITYLPSSQLRNNPDPTLAISPLLQEEVVIEGLQPYFEYSFFVFYENSDGQSGSSDIVEFSLPYSVPSGPPTDVSVIALGQTSLLIRWGLPLPLEQNGPIVGYEVVLTYEDTSKTYTSPFGDVFSIQIEGAPRFVEISITAAARTPAGLGPASMPITIDTTPENDTLSSPIIEESSIIDNTNVNLVWSHPKDPHNILLDYRVIYYGYMKEGETKVNKQNGIEIVDGPYTIILTATDTSYLIKDLQASLIYAIIVQVRTATGSETNSTEITVTIPDTVTPEPVGGGGETAVIVIAVFGWIILMLVVVVVVAVIIWNRRKRGHKKISKNMRSQPPVGIENRGFSNTGDQLVVDHEMDNTSYGVVQVMDALAQDTVPSAIDDEDEYDGLNEKMKEAEAGDPSQVSVL